MNKMWLKLVLLTSVLIILDVYFRRNLTGFRVSLFALAIAFIPIGILLLFLNRNILLSWLKFALGWMVLYFVVIFMSPEYGSSSFMPGPDRKTFSWIMSGLFLLISLILIAWKSWKLKNKTI